MAHPMQPVRLRERSRLALHSTARLLTVASMGWLAFHAHAQVVPVGENGAGTKGYFGSYVGEFGGENWPLIPIHAALLADGRVMTYGSDRQGSQGALIYDVWDPKLGLGTAAHLTLDNKTLTPTDIFCSAQTLLQNGTLFLAAGDRSIPNPNGGPDIRNQSTNAVTRFVTTWRGLFDWSPPKPLKAARWYPSVVTLNNGETLILGGRTDPELASLGNPAVPEVYNGETGLWRILTGAGPATTPLANGAYGPDNWAYPRAWQAPNGKVFIISQQGKTFYLNPTGTGAITENTARQLTAGHKYLPAVMYAPGKILSLRQGNSAQVVDINNPTLRPEDITDAGAPGANRYNGSATVLADGRVLVSGGTEVAYEGSGTWEVEQLKPVRTARIWDPSKLPNNNPWSDAAGARRMRTYHSISLLLPDGSVLTGGGGAPGPEKNRNVEIYYPPYLYKNDGTNQPAIRPAITQAPQAITWNVPFSVTSDAAISRVTLVRAGSVTHTVDFDQRFIELPLAAGTGATRTVTPPANANIAPPGMYMLFAFNAAGVPSKASLVYLGQAGATPPNRTTLQYARWATGQGGYWDGQGWFAGDFDGNGKADMAKAFDCGNGTTCIDTHLSNGSTTTLTRWASGQGSFNPSARWFPGDFDGNGKTDVAMVFDCGNGNACINVRLSNGTTSASVQSWGTNQGGIWNAQRWVAGDFNGDGKTDLAKVFPEAGLTSVDVHLSTGSAFTWGRWMTKQGAFADSQKWLAGDFNVDGKTDLAKVYDNGAGLANIDVLASTGGGFPPPVVWGTSQGGFWAAQKWLAADLNGDGITDLAKVFTDAGQASIDFHYSRKTGFHHIRAETRAGAFADTQKWIAGDFTGDGKADLANVFNGGTNLINIEVHR